MEDTLIHRYNEKFAFAEFRLDTAENEDMRKQVKILWAAELSANRSI
jgi:hypothetical protein